MALFHELYENRAATTDTVQAEVRRKALATNAEPQGIQSAAVRARNFFLNSARLDVQELPMSQEVAARLQVVLEQLRSYDAARRRPGMQGHGLTEKHAGEATLIVAATQRNNPVLLTNDAGASHVADRQLPNIPSRHFGHILHELVCHAGDSIQLDDVISDYEAACHISGIPDDARPSASTGYFTCSRDTSSGKCIACDQT
ncbi:hypothetical protein ACIP95_15810 [Micromonospora parva]|uniref:hypothetical protein n=1 Tax=Micromonospora parva TaxID=1464048 RepID=UPI0038204F08